MITNFHLKSTSSGDQGLRVFELQLIVTLSSFSILNYNCSQKTDSLDALLKNKAVQRNILAYSYSLFPRGVTVWNLLPGEAVEAAARSLATKLAALSEVTFVKCTIYFKRL